MKIKTLVSVITFLFLNTLSFSQEINISVDKRNTLIFTFTNNTECDLEVPKLIWRSYNKKKKKLTGILDENYYKVKGDTLIITLNKETPEYFKGTVNEIKSTKNPTFMDINLKPKEINRQEIIIKKRDLKKCNFIQLIYDKINYTTIL